MFAEVAEGIRGRTRHMIGLPPGLDDSDPPSEMPPARYVLVEQLDEGHFLFRFASDGSDGGDTWHQSLEQALEQAAFEFGLTEDAWKPIPTGLDPTRYVQSCARGELAT
jgi:hypothetical protein